MKTNSQKQKKRMIFIYSRVACLDKRSPDQCAQQRESCREYIDQGDAKGTFTFRYYTDNGYGATGPRPAYARMIRDLHKSGAFAIIAYSLDRLHRDLRSSLAFERTLISLGVALGTVREGTVISDRRVAEAQRSQLLVNRRVQSLFCSIAAAAQEFRHGGTI